MSTILTDDERPKLPAANGYVGASSQYCLCSPGDPAFKTDRFTADQMEAYADAREAAVLAKLAQQEPAAEIEVNAAPAGGVTATVWSVHLAPGTYSLHLHPAPQQSEKQCQHGAWIDCGICDKPHTHPAPQQADRQRVPEGWIGVVQAARDVLSDAEDHLAKPHSTAVRVALMQLDAMLAAAPEAPAQAEQAAEPVRDEREPSPTAGMTLWQRILHVGGRTNAAGYVEFGSVQAVDALVRHVLRDLPDAPPPQASAVDERAAFEEWALREYATVRREHGELRWDSPSVGAAVEHALSWWQARAALAQKGGK